MKSSENIEVKTHYQNITMVNGKPATHFTLTSSKGWCDGLFIAEEKKIFVHGITAQKGLKTMMDILVEHFKTNKIQFTPLITDMLEKKIKGGVVSIVPAEDKSNPYGEDIKVLDCVWETKK